MDQKELKELRDYYDNTSLADKIAEAELNTAVVQSPMVGITVRLPAEVLQRVRERAEQENIKTTALIRRWIEEHVEPSALFGGAQLPSAMSLATSGLDVVISELHAVFELHAGSLVLAHAKEMAESGETFSRMFGEDRVST
jgi:hypothetical protein